MPPPPRKPKVARKGDSQLEQLIVDVTSGNASPVQYGIFSAIVVSVLAIAGGVYYVMASKVVALSPEDTAALKDVFYSGEPWLIECTKERKASPVFYAAEGALSGFKFGTLDCAKVLPSGKTTYERFKLREPSYGPKVLAMANGALPQIAGRNVLSNGAELAKWATSVTPAKVFSPTTSEQFESQCVRKPWCVVVLSQTGRLVDAERAAILQLAATERRIRVVKLDETKTSLMLDLPGGVPPPTASEATVLLLKQLPRPVGAPEPSPKTTDGEEEGGGDDDSDQPPVAAMLLGGGLRDVSSSLSSIRAALKATAEVPPDFHKLVKRPAARPKRLPTPPSSPRPEQSYQRSAPTDPPSKTLTDAELKQMRAEREKLIKEAEQQRRKKMVQEEAAANNIVEETSDEADAGGGDGSEGGGVSGMALEEGGEGDAPAEEEVEAEEFE